MTAEHKPPKPQCKKGDVRDGTPNVFDVNMFPLALVNLQVSRVYLMSNEDVEKAMRGFEKFKAVVDFAEFAEGFAGSGGDIASGAIGIDAALNVFTSSVGQVTTAFDPGATLEESTIDLLKEVIKRVNRTRMAGYYSMSCPLVRVHVSCTPTEKCGGGQWVPGPSRFELTYGETIRIGHYPQEIDVLSDSSSVAAAAAAAIQRMTNYFAQQNAKPLSQIRGAAKACAGGH